MLLDGVAKERAVVALDEDRPPVRVKLLVHLRLQQVNPLNQPAPHLLEPLRLVEQLIMERVHLLP